MTIEGTRSEKKRQFISASPVIILIASVAFLFPINALLRSISESRYKSTLQIYVGFLLCLALVGIVISYLVLKRNTEKIERTFVVICLFLGVLYMFTMTPLSPPDEAHHYHSAYEVSNLLRFHWDKLEYGYEADFDYTDVLAHNNVSSAYNRIILDIFNEGDKSSLIPIPFPRDISYPLEYIPQAIAISIAKLLNANFVFTFFGGRLCNLLFFVFCVYLAVKTTPKFKLLFCIIGLLPMTLHQAASYSYDGFVNGMTFLLISLFLRSIYCKGPFAKKEALQLVVVGALLAPAKVVYATILLLAILIPKERFKNKKERSIFLSLVWGIPVIVTLLFILPTFAVLAESTREAVNWDGGKTYTLDFVFKHPLRTAEYFLRALKVYGTEWFEGSIGASLSGLTLLIDRRIIYGFVFLLLGASMKKTGMQDSIREMDRFVFLFASMISILLVMLSMFLMWTSEPNPIVLGVQGRYFIPVLPMLYLSCNNNTFIVSKPIDRLFLSLSVILNIDVIIQVLNYTVSH